MYPGMLEEICLRSLIPRDIHWDTTINSSLVHVGKPDEGIYQIAQAEAGFQSQEILFIDNTQENVDAAIKFGWKGYHYDPTDYDLANRQLQKYLPEVLI
jgi:FMN phosphatase YigB (HAD superfamily)